MLSRTSFILSIMLLLCVSAPSIAISIDDSLDIACMNDAGEEEELEELKLIFEHSFDMRIAHSTDIIDLALIAHHAGGYPSPILCLISPPPEV